MCPANLSPEMRDLLRRIFAYEQDVARFNPQDDGDVPPTVPVKPFAVRTRRPGPAVPASRAGCAAWRPTGWCCSALARAIARGHHVGKVGIDLATVNGTTRTRVSRIVFEENKSLPLRRRPEHAVDDLLDPLPA